MAAWHALLRPVGPLPPEVYWRRRGAVALAVVVGIVLIVVLSGGSGHRARPTPSTGHRSAAGPAVTPTVPVLTPIASAPVLTPTAAAASVSSTAPSPTAPSTPSGSPCDPGQLTVATTADAVSYPAGVDPRFLVAVANSGAACQLPEAPVAVVTSGTDRLWSSSDCAGSSPPAALGAGHQTLTIVWTRHRSEPGCATPPAGSDPAPGTYHVTVTVDGLVSTAVFHLS